MEKNAKYRKTEYSNEWMIGFYTMPRDAAVGKNTTLDSDWFRSNGNLVDWLRIKKSGLPDANLGCFADQNFAEGAVIGLYMGGEKGQKDCAVKLGEKYMVTCFSFSNSEAFYGQTAATMGMQMINDPTMHIVNGKCVAMEGDDYVKGEKRVNAILYNNGLVCATKDIKKDEEIFLEYKLHTSSTNEGSESDEGTN